MSLSNKEISSVVVDYLSKIIEKKAVSEDSADSLNVAIDCITEAFEFEREDVPATIESKFGGKTLNELLQASLQVKSISKNEEDVEVNIPVEDAEIKAKAESLKLEGNKAMAMKDFTLAIKKYTEAIDVLPTNAIYYANRAAAHSSLKEYDSAIADAQNAIEIDPSYSKGYSRLAFAKYALDKPEEALEAYKKVLDIEGDNATAVMKKDYETAKNRVEQSLNLEKSTPKETTPNASTNAGANAGMGGLPDMSSMLGGGLGGLLNNPQLMQAAQQMMSDPNSMQKIQSMMQNPAIRQMADSFSSGGTPDFSNLMNNPDIQNMASSLFNNPANGDAGNKDASPE